LFSRAVDLLYCFISSSAITLPPLSPSPFSLPFLPSKHAGQTTYRGHGGKDGQDKGHEEEGSCHGAVCLVYAGRGGKERGKMDEREVQQGKQEDSKKGVVWLKARLICGQVRQAPPLYQHATRCLQDQVFTRPSSWCARRAWCCCRARGVGVVGVGGARAPQYHTLRTIFA